MILGWYLKYMETESHSQSLCKEEAKLQCPVCRGATRISRYQRNRHAKNIFSILFYKLFHQRVCDNCQCSFTTLKIVDSIKFSLTPLLVWIFPEINSFSQEVIPTDLTPVIPRTDRKTPIKTDEEKNATVINLIELPFIIERVNQEVTVQMKCSLGKGSIDQQIKRAASTLGINLQLAIDQINALLCAETSEETENTDLIIKKNTKKSMIRKLNRKSRLRMNRKSQQAH
jgi:hypothetical protein